MGFDNRVFNVNGESKEDLALALKLAFSQRSSVGTARAWKVVPSHGLVFYWYASTGTHPLPVPLDAEGAAEIAWQWLHSAEGESTPTDAALGSWFKNLDHDGSNIMGWRAYSEDWGHVNRDSYAIVAIHRSYLWLGK